MTTPSSGGRYIRDKDGALRRVSDAPTPAAAPKPETQKPDRASRSPRTSRNSSTKD
jgi:hypothetical protein